VYLLSVEREKKGLEITQKHKRHTFLVKKQNMSKNNQTESMGFRELLNSMMKRRWFITAMVLGGFMIIMGGIFAAVLIQSPIAGEWKELLLLLLGAFIGSYGKIIDYWFSDTDKDKMLVQKMDEEDGVSLSNTTDIPNTPIVPMSVNPLVLPTTDQVVETQKEEKKGVEIDEDGDGVMDGLDFDGDGVIDEYFAHRQCEHVWGDQDGDGEEECLICGKIKDIE
jgi:hypothetical protein